MISMEFNEQAQNFHFKDAVSNYSEGNYSICAALCKIILILNKKNQDAIELLKRAELELSKVQNLTADNTESNIVRCLYQFVQSM